MTKLFVYLALFLGVINYGYGDWYYSPQTHEHYYREMENSYQVPSPEPQCYPVEAPCAIEPCNPCQIFSGVEVYAQALYWRPTYDDVEYAFQEVNTVDIPLIVQPEFNWGYRLGAHLAFCHSNLYLEGKYTYYTQSHSNSTEATGVVIPFFVPGQLANLNFASADIESKYQTADIVAGYRWLYCPNWESHLFVGARYFRIKEKEKYFYSGGAVNAPAEQRYGVTGWGPRAGFNIAISPFSCTCFKGLGIGGEFAGTVGIASRNNQLNQIVNVLPFPEGSIDFPSRLTTLFATDFKLELFYQLCCDCLDIRFAGGYELNYYFNARKRYTATNVLGIPPISTSGLGYGGPYVELAIGY